MDLENHVAALQSRVEELASELSAAQAALSSGARVFAVGPRGEVVAVRPGQRPPRAPSSQALVVWRPER